MICVAMLFSCPLFSSAQSYYLYSIVHGSQSKPRPSKAPKLPLVVELFDHTLIVPNSVIGFTLTLENDEGDVYTYLVQDTVVVIPPKFHGEYSVCIKNGIDQYYGIFEI